jgi:hypothetical protein
VRRGSHRKSLGVVSCSRVAGRVGVGHAALRASYTAKAWGAYPERWSVDGFGGEKTTAEYTE